MPEIDTQTLSRTGISLGVVLAVLAGSVPVIDWFIGYHAEFITAAEADEKITEHLHEIEEKVDQNTLSVNSLQAEVRLRFALQRLETLEGRLYVLRRDGADPELIHEVEADYTRALEYRDCLLAERSTCKHLELGRSR
jgi:hypothetical protein